MVTDGMGHQNAVLSALLVHPGVAVVVSTCALQAVPVAAGAADAVAGMKATSARTANRTATCTRIHTYPERPTAVLMRTPSTGNLAITM